MRLGIIIADLLFTELPTYVHEIFLISENHDFNSIRCITFLHGFNFVKYEGRAKSSVTNRLPWFYPRYILKRFTALERCVEKLMIPLYFVQIAFQLTELFQIEIDAVIYTDQFTCYNKKQPSIGWSGVHLLHNNASSHKCDVVKSFFGF